MHELGANQLVDPNFVVIDQTDLNAYQLKIKGNYDIQAMQLFLKDRCRLKEKEGFLIISKPEISDH